MHSKTIESLILIVQSLADGLTFKEISTNVLQCSYGSVEYITKVGRLKYDAVSNEQLIAVFFRKGLIK